jgi:cytochrome P450
MKRDFIDHGLSFGHFYIKVGLEDLSKPYRIYLSRAHPSVVVNDIERMKEFQELIPKFVDWDGRNDYGVSPARYFEAESLVDIRSGDLTNFKTRRGSFVKVIGINFASRFIPMVAAEFKKINSRWTTGKTLDMVEESHEISFSIITKALFGYDILDKIKGHQYTNWRDGKTEEVSFFRGFSSMFKDQAYASFEFPNLLSPKFMKMGKMNQTLIRNAWNVTKSLKEFLDISIDKDSVYCKLVRIADATKEELLWDLIFYLFAGHDTSSSCFNRCVFELSRSEESRKGILKETEVHILNNGKESIEDFGSLITPERLEKMDYLNWFVKEALRINPPTMRSIGYSAVQDFTTSDGLKIYKDQMIEFNLSAAHHRPGQWITPEKFIPERFDPESPFFLTPKGK